jgi:thiazole synthase
MTRVTTRPPATPALAAGSVDLTVNGEPRAVRRGSTLDDLLRELQLDARHVVVEHNHAIVRDHAALGRRHLAEGDVVELVHFVGGG